MTIAPLITRITIAECGQLYDLLYAFGWRRAVPTTEAPIQAFGKDLCEALGGVTLRQHKGKGVTTGWPDSCHMLPWGVLIWIEYKAPGKGPTAIQAERIKQLRELGQSVFVCNSFGSTRAAFAQALGFCSDTRPA